MSKKILVFHPDCGACKPIKEALKERIASGEIGMLDASTEEGFKIAKDNGVTGVPECLEQNEDGTYKACSLEELLKK